MEQQEYKIKSSLKITKLDWFIIKKFLGTFFFSLAIFIVIIIIFDIAEKLDNFLREQISFHEIVFGYFVNFILFYISILSPLVIFLSVIFFTAKMASDTEIVPILSSGVSYRRFMYPYFIAGAFLSVLFFIGNAYIVPPAARTKLDFEQKYIRKNHEYRERNIHFQADSNSYIYMQSYSVKENTGYRFALERFNKDTLLYKLMAAKIVWDTTARQWNAEHYSIRYNEGLSERIETGRSLPITLNISPQDFESQEHIQGTMTLSQLNDQIALETLRGSGNTARFEMDKWRILTTPVSIFILIVIAVSLSSKKTRGGVGVPLGIGIACSFAYIILMQFAAIFSTKGGMPPVLAAWIPHLIFGALAVYLYRIAPK